VFGVQWVRFFGGCGLEVRSLWVRISELVGSVFGVCGLVVLSVWARASEFVCSIFGGCGLELMGASFGC
jgi:hypothetical protein